MTTKTSICAALALSTLGSAAMAASAGIARTFVSGHGADSGTCGLAAPCRSFAYAITQTTPGGEIAVLDTAGYGPVLIQQAVSIVNPGGVEAGITTTSGGTAITINAGSTDAVALRGLTIEGAGIGGTGVIVNSGGSLTMVDCFVRDFKSNGIVVGPSSSDTVTAVFNRVEVDNNGGIGIIVTGGTGTVYASVADSEIANNGNGLGSAGVATKVMVSRSVLANNTGDGFYVESGGTLLIGQSTVTGNGTDWSIGTEGGTLQSYGNNQINLNAATSGQLPKVTGGDD